jgi:hypothetical protein
MASHMMPIFQRGSRGGIIHREISADYWPLPGWYDSPDKVPGVDPEPPAGYGKTTMTPAPAGPVYGEPVKKSGFPKGGKRGADGKLVRAK